MTHIILASASPRRRELIHQIGWEEEICPSDFLEAKTVGEAEAEREKLPEKDRKELSAFSGSDLLTIWNARGKAMDIWKRKGNTDPIVAADTIVVYEDQTLGKPKDEADAKAMLTMLSGRVHEVKTGLAVVLQGKLYLHVETTKVYFRTLSEKEIDKYVSTGEPMDKAGAYGIQGKGAVLVQKIEGSYDNVVGLPLTALYTLVTGDCLGISI